MMNCNDIFHRLDAFVDGETSAGETREIDLHLQRCASCQARADQLRALTVATRDELRRERAPGDLWARIDAQLPPTSTRSTERPEAAWWQRTARPLALAASVALLLGIGGGVAWWQLKADDSVVAAPVQDFATYRVSGRALDIETSEPSVIHAWFEEKLTFEMPPVKARVAGFDLVGGRLCWFLDRRISALAYERGHQKVAVYVMTDHDLSLPEASFEPELRINRSVHEIDEINTMIWHHDGLVYSVVSDLKEADLSIFLAALARGERRNADLTIDLNRHQEQPMGAPT